VLKRRLKRVTEVPALRITIFSFAQGRQAPRESQRVQLIDKTPHTLKVLGSKDNFSNYYTTERAETESDYDCIAPC